MVRYIGRFEFDLKPVLPSFGSGLYLLRNQLERGSKLVQTGFHYFRSQLKPVCYEHSLPQIGSSRFNM